MDQYHLGVLFIWAEFVWWASSNLQGRPFKPIRVSFVGNKLFCMVWRLNTDFPKYWNHKSCSGEITFEHGSIWGVGLNFSGYFQYKKILLEIFFGWHWPLLFSSDSKSWKSKILWFCFHILLNVVIAFYVSTNKGFTVRQVNGISLISSSSKTISVSCHQNRKSCHTRSPI